MELEEEMALTEISGHKRSLARVGRNVLKSGN
jgi:hypothetical protein